MNKKALWLVGAILVIIIASITYVLMTKKDMREMTRESGVSGQPAQDLPLQQTPEEPSIAGKYVDYTSEALASAKGTTLLFFYASWCPQCRMLEASIKESKLPDNTTIFKVDYDTNQALRQRYGVTLQTTVVKVDEKGDKIASYVAYEEPNFAAVQRALLP